MFDAVIYGLMRICWIYASVFVAFLKGVFTK